MPWGKIDDRAWRHVRFDGVSLSAYGLFWAAISYSNEKLLDGVMTPPHLAQLRGFRQASEVLVNELVEAGLWLKLPAGYQIHDYFQYNESKAEIVARRQQNAEAQARWRERHPQKVPGEEESNQITNPITNHHVPYPGTPVPNQKSQTLSHESAPNGASPRNQFADFLDRLKRERNQVGVLGDALAAVYDYPADFPRLGKLAKEIGGGGELLKLVFTTRPGWNTVDDPHDYLAGAIRRRKSNGKANGRAVDDSEFNVSHGPDDFLDDPDAHNARVWAQVEARKNEKHR